jgi:hypothetical protein
MTKDNVQKSCEYCDGTGDVHDQTGEWRGTCHCVKASQRQWVGLTDEEIEQEFGFIDELLRDCVQRIEAKLKEKNT